MLRNYITVAWRNLLRNKENSIIHVFGLTIGLAGCLLIGLFVIDELKYDTFHPEGDRTYRIYTSRSGQGEGAVWASTSPAYGPALQANFPEIDQTLRIYSIRQKQLFKKDEQIFLEEKGLFAEPSILKIFHLPLLYGDPETALNDINSIIFTQPLSEKYFGSDNPVGESILINKLERKITGVLKPLPQHFHLDFNFLVSFENLLAEVPEERINSWVWQDFMIYLRLRPGIVAKEFSSKLSEFVEKNAHPQTQEFGFTYYPHLQKLEDIYLHSTNFRNDKAIRGDYQYVWGLSLVGIFLLLIACINFINLTTAKAIRRSKEVGIRKTSGAMRSQLVVQFVLESLLVVAISMLIAGQLTKLIIPYLNEFTDKSLTFNWMQDPVILMVMLGMILITGLVAGAYPALILSGFNPVEALKGIRFHPDSHIRWLRKALLALQFTLSIIMIISVLIIFQQVNFLRSKELGFQKEQLMHFPMKNKLFDNFDNTKFQFLQVPGVISATTCFGIPGDIVSGDNIIIPGEARRNVPARIFAVDHDYISTMGMKLVAGRDFNKEIRTDSEESFIVNETSVKELNIAGSPEDAIGKPLEWEGWDEEQTIKKGKIIGVVGDFHYTSLHEEVQPSVLHIYPDAYWKLALRIETSDLDHTIAGIKEKWDHFETGYPIDYQFVDEGFGVMYKSESKLNSLLWVFAVLAIIISCIGAFGLAAYAAEQRRKEIGIRKILGASVPKIVALMTREFLILVLIALLIATPVAIYFLSGWLDEFAYSIQIQWWTFIIAGFIIAGITLLTVGYQSLKAAFANPVDSLRNE